MQLSKRLQAIADFVTPGNRVADVGCDHAYISIHLVKEARSPHIIAMDINQGPLDRARNNIERYGYTGRIDLRRSNGLQKLIPGEADTVLIAGMGGALTRQILTDRLEVLAGVRELILQPQSEINLVREALGELGFLITEENMLKEDGKYYVCMKAAAKGLVSGQSSYELNREEHYYYGRLLLEHKNPVLYEYLLQEKQQCENIYSTLIAFPTAQSILRQREICAELKLIEQAFEYY